MEEALSELRELQILRVRETELLRHWLNGAVVVTEPLSQKRDVEVYKYALCCAEVRLLPQQTAIEDDKKLTRLTRKNSLPMTRSMLEMITEAVIKEIFFINSEGESLYAISLRSFRNDLRRRQDDMLNARISLMDLLNLFSEIVSKEMVKKLNPQVTSDAEASISRFGSLMSKTLRVKLSKFQSTLTEDSEHESFADFLADVFQVSRGHKEIALQIAFAQSQKGSFLEMLTNLALIDCHPYYNLAAFPTREMLDAWKAHEVKEVHSLLQKIDPIAYDIFDIGEKSASKKGQPWIRIKVIKAKDLTPKGPKCNPYCSVEYGSDVFETAAAGQVTDPTWDEQVTLPVKGSNATVSIQIKSKVDEESAKLFSKRFWMEDGDHFLGQVTLSVDEITQKGPLPWEGWFPLQKRSRRSHITGEIYLSITNLPPGTVDFEKTVHAEKPAVVHCELYKYLLRALLKYDAIHGGQLGELSPKSARVLGEYALRYRLGALFQAISRFGMLVELFNSNSLSVHLLSDAYHDIQSAFRDLPVRTKDEEAMYELALGWSCEPLLSGLVNYGQSFPLAKPAGSIETSIKLLLAFEADPLFRPAETPSSLETGDPPETFDFKQQLVQRLQKTSVDKFEQFLKDSVSSNGAGVTNYEKLVDAIMDALEEDTDYFEKPFSTVAGFSVTQLNTFQFGVRLRQLAEEVVASQLPSDDVIVLSNLIAFYHKLLEFKEDWLDPVTPSESEKEAWLELQKEFAQEGPFTPVFKKWVGLIDAQIKEWIQRAIEVDSLEAVGEGSLHSSSIVDCFSAFDQAAAFLVHIKFQNQALRVHLINLFGGIVTRNLQYYFSTLYSDSVSQFQVTTKSRYSIFHSSKAKYALPYEISGQNLVKLNNLEVARKYLHQLSDNIDIDSVMTVMGTLPEMSLSKEALQGQEGFSGNLQLGIMMASGLKSCDANGRSDPYAVVSLGDQVIAKTRTIEKTLNPKWEEKFEALVQDARELKVRVYDKDLFRVDDTCGEATFSLESLMDGYEHDVEVELIPQGTLSLRIKLEVTGIQDIDFYFKFMFKYLRHQTTDFIHLFMEQMSPFFRESSRKLLADTKSATGILGWSELDPMVQAQQALQTLMKYLESNIPVLTTRLYPTVSVNVLKKTWKEVLKAIMVTLLPNIEEDVVSRTWFSPKKALLTPRQVSVISSSVDVLRDFFEAKGLEGKDLRNHVLGELMLAVELYGKPTRLLIKRYLRSLEEDQNEKGNRERYVMLHVLQLQEDQEAKKFVEDMLKDTERERKWTTRRISDSSSSTDNTQNSPSLLLASPPMSPLLVAETSTRKSS